MRRHSHCPSQGGEKGNATRKLAGMPAQGSSHRSVASRILTVVAAPAGYGKTVMAHKLTNLKLPDGKQRRHVFHSIPQEISSVREWWDSLFASLVNQGMEGAQEIRRTGFPHTPSMARQAVELLENADPFLLILDDFHNFADPTIDAFLEALVRAKPSAYPTVHDYFPAAGLAAARNMAKSTWLVLLKSCPMP